MKCKDAEVSYQMAVEGARRQLLSNCVVCWQAAHLSPHPHPHPPVAQCHVGYF